MPEASVAVIRSWPVPWLRTVIGVLGITDPVASKTVPVMVPVDCPKAEPTNNKAVARTAQTALRLNSDRITMNYPPNLIQAISRLT